MSEQFDRSAAALPYDKWFNGNLKLQVENGTFEDCREINEKHLADKKLKPEVYKSWCKVWDGMSIEEKTGLYKALEEETTPRPFKLPNGKTVMVSEPSDNGAPRRKKKNQVKQSLKSKRPPGSLDFSNSKLAAQAAQQTEGQGVEVPSTSAVPDEAPVGAEAVPVAV